MSIAAIGCGGNNSNPPEPDGPATCGASTYRWATEGGGDNGDIVTGTAIDADGNTWVIGTFIGAATWGTFQLSSPDTTHTSIFVAKLDPTGKVLLARTLAGADNVQNTPTRIRAAANGDVFVAGLFAQSLTLDGVTLTENDSGNGAGFVMELDGNGSAVMGLQTIGNSDRVIVDDLAFDASGDLYVTGSYNGDITLGGLTTTAESGVTSVFVAKYSMSTSEWVWLDGWSGMMNQSDDGGIGYGVAVAGDGSVYATGSIAGTLLVDTTTLTADGGSFLVKLGGSDGSVAWATQLTPTAAGDRDYTSSIVADSAGAAYVAGTFAETPELEPAGSGNGISLSPTADGGHDMFVAKYGADGTPAWAVHGGTATGLITRADDLAFDGQTLYTGGFTQGDVVFASSTLTDSSSAFVAAFDTSGNLGWAQGVVNDVNADDSAETFAIAVHPATGGIAIGGGFVGMDTFGTTMLSGPNEGDAFVAAICN
ncbi:MAG TPA: hypothetical protein VGG74_02350 [Kofleriaceae bacterium]|jgi:hypothetical protein